MTENEIEKEMKKEMKYLRNHISKAIKELQEIIDKTTKKQDEAPTTSMHEKYKDGIKKANRLMEILKKIFETTL